MLLEDLLISFLASSARGDHDFAEGFALASSAQYRAELRKSLPLKTVATRCAWGFENPVLDRQIPQGDVASISNNGHRNKEIEATLADAADRRPNLSAIAGELVRIIPFR